jgi:Arc/MetJ family transcription regulator
MRRQSAAKLQLTSSKTDRARSLILLARARVCQGSQSARFHGRPCEAGYGPKGLNTMYIIHATSCSCNASSDVQCRTMKTHIELDDELLEEVFQLGGFATKKAAVNTALAEYAKMLKRRELLAMRGQVRWEGDLAALRADRRGRRP